MVPGQCSSATELAPGQVLVRVDRFAFTANNITYGAVGDSLGYWSFFPAGEPGWGRIPVWGFGDVVRSTHAGVPAGERLYGYFPMSTHVVLHADRVSPASFVDAAAHRAGLPPIYNRYERVGADPAHDRAREPALALFRPLFGTAFLLDDFLAENDVFGAHTVVLSSASSKTALGLAFLLSTTRRERCRVVGLTGARHVSFVAGTGYCHEVLSYDRVTALPDGPAVFVDVAGHPEVRRAVHGRYGERLRHSAGVGVTHWEHRAGLQGDGSLPGPPSTFFFAPDHARKVVARWGPAAFQARVAAALGAFLTDATRWLRIREARGAAAVEAAYRATLDGAADPAEGHVLGL